METFGSLLAQQVQMEGNPIVALITGVVGFFFWLGLYIVMAVALMTIAKKTNTPNEWWAWVPILNVILMLQIAELELWYIILLFIPCVNLFVAIYTWWKIAERRGKPGAIAILMLVPFINFFVPLYKQEPALGPSPSNMQIGLLLGLVQATAAQGLSLSLRATQPVLIRSTNSLSL